MTKQFELIKDKKGLWWDVILYVPTVLLLMLFASKQWFSGGQPFAYLLSFLACFIFIIGANRIFKGKLLLFSSSPIALKVDKELVSINLKSGDVVNLAKDVRFYPDYAGKSFGLTGLDLTGKKHQFVLYRGQFDGEAQYNEICEQLNIYK